MDQYYSKLNMYQRQVFDAYVKSVDFIHAGVKSTLCLITCHNGFEQPGHSAPVIATNYNAELGRECALIDALEKLAQVYAFDQHRPKEY